MNNQIQLVLKSSTTELSLNDRELGIYLTPELDGLTGLPEIRTTSGVNAGYDGGWTSAQNYDARSITIRGVIANEDVATVEQLRRQLTTLAGQGKNEELTLDLVTQAGKAYTIQVRTIALEMSLQKVLTQQEFMLQLRADDPLIYDASETTHEALLQVAQATGGFTIDFELPLAITGSSEETVVNNEGLEQVPTVARMYGELHNPKIINQTTNQFMQINADLGFAEGDWIEPSEVVSGKDITINGAPEGAPLSSVQIEGETSQQTYTGKNLVYTSGKTDGGITATYNAATGETTISGKAQRTYAVFGTVEDVLPAGTYTFSIQSAAPCSVGVATRTSGGTRQGNPISTGATKTTFTISEDSPRYDIYLTSLTVNTTYSFTFKAMLESGSSATSFEPYVGGIPAPNPDYPQAVQTVTGENVVKICGKNLYPFSDTVWSSSSTSAGWIFQDGAVGAFGGDITSRTAYKLTLPAGTYTVTAYNISSNVVHIQACANGSPNEMVITNPNNINSGNPTSTITLTEQTTLCFRYRVTNPSLGIGNTKIQVEKGSATAYEPYQGQSYEVNLGKNLFDKDNANIAVGTIGSTAITLGGSNKFLYIPCEPNATYTVQKRNDGDVNRFAVATTSVLPADGVSTSGLIQGNNASSITITTASSAKYLEVMYYRMQETTLTEQQLLDSIQIEKGSQATSYAAYFTPIELCKIGTYQDYIYKSGGKWYVRKETGKRTYTADDITIAANDAYSNVRYAQFPKGADNKQYGNYTYGDIINFFTHGINMGAVPTGGWNSYISDGLIYNSAMQDNYWCSFAKSTVLATMKEKLNGIVAYYVLATPTDTEITNEALVAQLEALAAATMYHPQTNIITLYAEGNEQPTLDVSYFTDKNPDTRDELVIDSRLRTITLNGLDVYHLQAPGSEFLMLASGENRLALQSDITGDNGYAQVSYKQGYLSI